MIAYWEVVTGHSRRVSHLEVLPGFAFKSVFHNQTMLDDSSPDGGTGKIIEGDRQRYLSGILMESIDPICFGEPPDTPIRIFFPELSIAAPD